MVVHRNIVHAIADIAENDELLQHNDCRANGHANVFGLVNNGAMCWLNSLMQVILSLPAVKSTVRKCVAEGPNKYPVMAALDKFLAAAEINSGAAMDATPVLTELMRACPGFGGRQEDAAEGLMLLLDKMHPDVSRLFESVYRMDIYCDSCRDVMRPNVGQQAHNETMIYVPIERNFVTIDTSGNPFEQFLAGHMSRLDAWPCPKCGVVSDENHAAMRIARLIKRPEILVVAFNKYDLKWRGPEYGQNIELKNASPELGFRAAQMDGDGDSCRAKYSLTGVIRHYGGHESGHYNVVCRRPSGVWLFDDAVAGNADFRAEIGDYMLIYS